jgi:cell division septation protein DedD
MFDASIMRCASQWHSRARADGGTMHASLSWQGIRSMLAKFGLVILIVIFGAGTFVAGTMAPDDFRQHVAAIGARVLGQPVPTASTTPPVVDDALALVGAPAPPPLAAKPAAPATPVAAAEKPAPVRLESLLVTAAIKEPQPGKGEPTYALQVGQFATEDDANATIRRLKEAGLGLPLTSVPVLDADNEPWSVVAIGQFASSAAAQRAAPRVQSVLDIRETPVIQLPPSDKPTS